MNSNFPSVNVYSLDDLNLTMSRDMIEIHSSTLDQLSSTTISGIINALNRTIIVNRFGYIYVNMRALHTLLRTSGIGSANYFVNQGIEGLCSPAEPISFNDGMYITGADFLALVYARIQCTSGRQQIYLRCVRDLFIRLSDQQPILNLISLRSEIVSTQRNQLKHRRISSYGITSCEFTGTIFNSRDEVDFAHIESVDTNPLRSLNIDNGVIILKAIHRDLTSRGIQDFVGMLQYCEEKNYYIGWAENIE